MKDDYNGQMIFGDLVSLKLPDIYLTDEEKPEKTSPRKLVPTGIEPGHAAWQARMLPPAPQRRKLVLLINFISRLSTMKLPEVVLYVTSQCRVTHCLKNIVPFPLFSSCSESKPVLKLSYSADYTPRTLYDSLFCLHP